MNENETINNQVNEKTYVTQQPNNNTNNFNNYDAQGLVKKKKGKGPIILITIILLIVAALAGMYVYMTTPAQYYKMTTNLIMDNVLDNLLGKEYETAKSTVNLGVELKPEMEIIDEEILDLINDFELKVEVQQDKNKQSAVLGIGANYDKENLIDAKAFIDAKNEETYLYLPEFLDKYLEVEMEEDSIYSELIEIFETEITDEQKEKAKKLNDIIKKEITKNIKSEYCSNKDVKIKINGEDVKTSCKTIQMNPQQIMDNLIVMCDNLLKNEAVFDLIKEEYKEDFKDFLEKLKEELEYEKEDLSEDMIIKINTYTTGLLPKVVKFEFIMEAIEEERSLIIEATKLEEQNYSYLMKIDEENIISGKVNITENSIKVETEIEEFGSFEIEVGATEEYNIEIDKIDEDNTVTLEELTGKEIQTLMENLEKSKLYELINSFIPEESENITELNDSVSGLKDNQIYTYDDKTLITFGTISGYKYDRISQNYQTLSKGDVDISISSEMCDQNGYYQQLNSTKEYFSEQTYYSDVILSNMKSATIGENTFYHATIQYKYEYSDELEAIDYIWTEVSDNYVIKIEIDNMKNITNDELKQLLTMTFENK